MNAAEIREALRAMAERPGFLAVGLVELAGGMVWHAAGAPEFDESVVSAVSDYWRLYTRSRKTFASLGDLSVAVLLHRAGRITLCECGSGMLLVSITSRGLGADWETWKQDQAHLARLVNEF